MAEKFRIRPTEYWRKEGFIRSTKPAPAEGTAWQHRKHPDLLHVEWDGYVTPQLINKKFVERIDG